MARRRKPIPFETRLRVYNDCDGKCLYCREKVPFPRMVLEHKIPIVRGGDDKIDNLTLSCRKCDKEKGTFTEHEFLSKKSGG